MLKGGFMRFKPRTWFLISLLLFGAGAWMWHYGDKVRDSRRNAATATKSSTAVTPPLLKTSATAAITKRKTYRLSNTRETIAKLLRNDHAIILRNAIIDTTHSLNLGIPEHLRAKGAPGSYIVQFDRPVNGEFYDSIKKDGATFVSYIPNNAALVKADADAAKKLQEDAVFQAVIPYEPYYKLDNTLLPGAVDQQPQTNMLSVTAFPGERDATVKALTDLGAKVIGEDPGPFGSTLVVTVPPDSVAAIAQLPVAKEVEAYIPRRTANDLSRVQLGVSADTLVGTSNYLNLTGQNVIVNLNDTGVDSTHADFGGPAGTTRLFGNPNALVDGDGHGTHVAGIIIGDGADSADVTNQIPGSIIPGADFRGKATNAILYVQSLDLNFGPYVSDAQLVSNASVQLGPTNLISNNSWTYGTPWYDMHAAAYDAATRDAQPGVTGEQPLLFVFASGNNGNGADNGIEGQPDSIFSPATCKNGITVGASDSPRYITNEVTEDFMTTNELFYGWTDNSNLVAWFSGCGNVGIGQEGNYGRFKPDVVAPGVFIVSCRSSNYIDPTNETYVTTVSVTNQTVIATQTNYYPIAIPSDTAELVIRIDPNNLSPTPFPGLRIFADPFTPPVDIVGFPGTNTVYITNTMAPTNWYVGIATLTNQLQPVAYDLTLYVVETNSLGDYFQVLSNLNTALMPDYVYQSGTSMSAGAVSGMLALMQEFLETRMNTVPSPALLKALLINGSRSINLQYDFNVQTFGPNEQGWGMPNMATCLPGTLTNPSPSMVFIDQSNITALATGQSQSFQINCADQNVSNSPVRITLVWTDPPGDPAAGIALVNDLTLTAIDATGSNVYIGNDFFSGDIFSEANTGDAPDLVNNVQNIYLDGTYTPIAFPLTVTVSGYRVNVNAVPGVTNLIAQDCALVVSTDDSLLQSPLTVLPEPIVTPPPTPVVTVVTSGVPLLHERVGANEPNYYNYALGQTNGNLQQWHFFVFTNQALLTNPLVTNVAFTTFLPPNLSIPRNTQADIDMYVSTRPALLNLGPLAISTAYKSVGRGGTETFVTTNGTNLVWYIGIKSEDQQAADFGFYAIAQQAPFSVNNPDGSVTAIGTAVPVIINDAASGPAAYVFAFLIDPANPSMLLQNVTVSLNIPHGNPSDLYGTLNHDGVQTVINHYTGPPGGFSKTYDDLQENLQSTNSITDGPGTLKNYIGMPGQGMWQLTEADNAIAQGGQVGTFNVTGYPAPLGLGFTITLQPNEWYKGYVGIPNDATNLAIYLTYTSQSGGPVGLYLTNFDNVQLGDYGTNAINPPGGFIGLNTNPPVPPANYPPLAGGTWYYGIYNAGTQPVTLNVLIQIQESLTPNLVETFTNNTVTPLATDATTGSQICIGSGSGQQVVDLSVGVRIADTNLDDLALHLTSPQGTSVLLFENRGGLAANNLGLSVVSTNARNALVTNLVYTVFTEDTNLTTTPIKFTPVFATNNVVTTNVIITNNSFETVAPGTYGTNQTVEGWTVVTNQVGIIADANLANTGTNFMALTSARITNTFTVVPGASYELRYWARGPGARAWWPANDSAVDIINGNNGTLSGGTTYSIGENGDAFSFFGTNQFVTVPDSPTLHLSSVTIECWFNAASSHIVGNLLSKPVGAAWYDSYQIWLTDGALNGIACNAATLGPQLISPFSPVPGLWYHAAYTVDSDAKIESLYINGVLVDSGVQNVPIGVDGDSLLMGTELDYGSPLLSMDGKVDEISLYNRALSPAELQAIYAAGSNGKYSPNGILYPNFQVSIDGYSTNTMTNSFSGGWQLFTNSFIPTNSVVTIELAGNTMSTLFDDIQLVQLPSTNYNNYYQPEEPLTPFVGQNPQGCWTLEVWDTRTDSSLANNGVLVSWDLQMTISSTNVDLTVLTNRVPYTKGTVSSNSITYFAIDVPPTANFATNILFNSSSPLNLIFDQNSLPTGALPGDVTLLNGVTVGSNTIATEGMPPPLVPGSRYFLGVQNTSATAATFDVEVDFDVGNNTNIVALANEVYFDGTNISTNGADFYSFIVPTNATMVTFQVLNPANAELDLYARAGLPVPGPFNFDYQSRNAGASDQFIVITTNSTPVPLPVASSNTVVPLTPTTWYLSVYNPAGVTNVGYTIVATYSTSTVTNSLTPGTLDLIPLNQGTNASASYTTNAVPGFPTNFMYAFTVTNNPPGLQFTVVNNSGNGNVQLLVQPNTLPTPQQTYAGSFNSGTANQLITFGPSPTLPSLNGTWYLAVPNNFGNNPVSYTITAATLKVVPVTQPFFVGANISSAANQFSLNWSASPGQNYTIQASSNLITWNTITNLVAQTNTVNYTDSVPVNSQQYRFYRIASP
jgi:subtilisin-like proprotein convertase family protein